MRVVVMIKANKDTEAGVMPSQQLLEEMGKYNEELVKAGVMLSGEGLHPSAKGKRVRSAGGKITVEHRRGLDSATIRAMLAEALAALDDEKGRAGEAA